MCIVRVSVFLFVPRTYRYNRYTIAVSIRSPSQYDRRLTVHELDQMIHKPRIDVPPYIDVVANHFDQLEVPFLLIKFLLSLRLFCCRQPNWRRTPRDGRVGIKVTSSLEVRLWRRSSKMIDGRFNTLTCLSQWRCFEINERTLHIPMAFFRMRRVVQIPTC